MDSPLVRVSVRLADPLLAEAVAKAIAQSAMVITNEMNAMTAGTESEFIQNRIAELRARLHDDEID